MDKFKLNPMRIVLESNPDFYYHQETSEKRPKNPPAFFVTVNGQRIEDVKSFRIELDNEKLRESSKWNYKIEHEISCYDDRFVEKIESVD